MEKIPYSMNSKWKLFNDLRGDKHLLRYFIPESEILKHLTVKNSSLYFAFCFTPKI